MSIHVTELTESLAVIRELEMCMTSILIAAWFQS